MCIVPATHIYIVSDCTAAIHLFEHGGGQSVLLARRPQDLMAQLATKVIVECVWIPSHGKKSPAWQSHPILAESDLRAWNAVADLSASWFKQRILDKAWELDALSSLASIAERYAAHVAVLKS